MLKSFWWLVVNVGYLLLILLASFIIFTVPEQTKDFIYVFLQDFEVPYMIAVYLSLIVWSFITWYSACIILQIDPIKGSLDRKDDQTHIYLSLVLPKILGVTPCLIFLYSIAATKFAKENHSVLHIGLIAMITVAMWVLFAAIDKSSEAQTNINQNGDRNAAVTYTIPDDFFQFIKDLWSLTPLGNWPSLREVDIFKNSTRHNPSFKQEIYFIAQFTGVRFFYTWLGTFCLGLTLIMCIPAVNLFLSSWLRPGAILILSIASFTLLFTIIAYFHDYARRPFGILVLVMVVVFSYFNDNTGLEYFQNTKANMRLTVDNAFDKWLNVKKKAWYKNHPDTTDMPVVFIATQGGGIRGMTWTTRVLHYLDSVHNGFMNQTFLISGVSGGGVGATAYLSWLHDRIQAPTNPPLYEQFNNFTKRDFLSPVTAAFAFGDNFQRFLPLPISSLDRSKMLGRAWEKYYFSSTGKKSLSRSFLEMWYPENGFAIPSLVLNGTLAENGQKVITSNLKISGSQWFVDDIDFFSFTEKDISRSTAALNCSRFPIITSGGLMERGSDRKGHIVDGGYRENTGLQSLLNVFCLIKKRLSSEKRIKVIVLYIQNGVDELNKDVSASKVMQDLIVPMQGLIQVNGAGLPAKSIVQFANQMFNESICTDVRFLTLSLESRENHEIKLPLGWYMSDIVSKEIDQRVRDIPKIDSGSIIILDHWFH